MAVDYVSHQRELLGYGPLGFKQSGNVSAEKQKVIPPLQLGPNISNADDIGACYHLHPGRILYYH